MLSDGDEMVAIWSFESNRTIKLMKNDGFDRFVPSHNFFFLINYKWSTDPRRGHDQKENKMYVPRVALIGIQI